MLRPLRHRPIQLLWLGQTLSAIGDQAFAMAVLWIAAQRGGADVGLVGATQYGVQLLSGMFVGVYADRWNRRYTMIAVDLLRAALVAFLPLYALFDTLPLWLLTLVGAALLGLSPLFDASLSASLPLLMPDQDLLQATNGLMNTTKRIARLLGPLLVAWLARVLSVESLFVIDLLTFVISAATVFAVGAGFAWRTGPVGITSGWRGIFAEQALGLRELRARPVVWWAIWSTSIPSMLWGLLYIAGFPLIAVREFGNDIGAYGLLISAYGVGNLVANITVGSRSVRRRVTLIWLGHITFSLGFAGIGAAPLLALALARSMLAALGGPMGDLMTTNLIQQHMPRAHTGKAFAFLYSMWTGSMVIGLLIATALYSALPTRAVFIGAGLIAAAIGAAGLWKRAADDQRAATSRSYSH
jgi:MFS family permease